MITAALLEIMLDYEIQLLLSLDDSCNECIFCFKKLTLRISTFRQISSRIRNLSQLALRPPDYQKPFSVRSKMFSSSSLTSSRIQTGFCFQGFFSFHQVILDAFVQNCAGVLAQAEALLIFISDSGSKGSLHEVQIH